MFLYQNHSPNPFPPPSCSRPPAHCAFPRPPNTLRGFPLPSWPTSAPTVASGAQHGLGPDIGRSGWTGSCGARRGRWTAPRVRCRLNSRGSGWPPTLRSTAHSPDGWRSARRRNRVWRKVGADAGDVAVGQGRRRVSVRTGNAQCGVSDAKTGRGPDCTPAREKIRKLLPQSKRFTALKLDYFNLS